MSAVRSTFVTSMFRISSVRFWPLADHHFSGFLTFRSSALPLNADIQLILSLRSARDPKRAFAFLTWEQVLTSQETAWSHVYETNIGTKTS